MKEKVIHLTKTNNSNTLCGHQQNINYNSMSRRGQNICTRNSIPYEKYLGLSKERKELEKFLGFKYCAICLKQLATRREVL